MGSEIHERMKDLAINLMTLTMNDQSVRLGVLAVMSSEMENEILKVGNRSELLIEPILVNLAPVAVTLERMARTLEVTLPDPDKVGQDEETLRSFGCSVANGILSFVLRHGTDTTIPFMEYLGNNIITITEVLKDKELL